MALVWMGAGKETDGLLMFTHTIPVAQEETKTFYMTLVDKGIIKGIKALGSYDTGDFHLNIYTSPENSEYVYASGKVSQVLWDIMDIPFVDESGHNTVYCSLYNKGATTEFTIKIYVKVII